MKSNIPPNGHSHISDKLVQTIRAQEQQLRQAVAQIQQMSLALKSVSTLAAMYKAQLEDISKQCESFIHQEELVGSEDIYGTIQPISVSLKKAQKLLAAGHMEPVNEIIKLTLKSTADKELISAQKNMIEQMEQEINNLKKQ